MTKKQEMELRETYDGQLIYDVPMSPAEQEAAFLKAATELCPKWSKDEGSWRQLESEVFKWSSITPDQFRKEDGTPEQVYTLQAAIGMKKDGRCVSWAYAEAHPEYRSEEHEHMRTKRQDFMDAFNKFRNRREDNT